MSHSTETNTPSNKYSDKELDRMTRARLENDLRLMQRGAKHVLGHFHITEPQFATAQAEMDSDMTKRAESATRRQRMEEVGEFTLAAAQDMDPTELERLTRESVWNVLSLRAHKRIYGPHPQTGQNQLLVNKTLSIAEDMNISPDEPGTGYVDFVLAGQEIRQDKDYNRHAVTLALDGSYVGISNRIVNVEADSMSHTASEAILDIQLSSGRNTDRFSGRWNKPNRHGSHDATLEDKVYIINTLNLLGDAGPNIKTKISSRTRAVYHREKPYRK